MPEIASVVVFQAEDGIRDVAVTGVQTCALPIYSTIRPKPGERLETHPRRARDLRRRGRDRRSDGEFAESACATQRDCCRKEAGRHAPGRPVARAFTPDAGRAGFDPRTTPAHRSHYPRQPGANENPPR